MAPNESVCLIGTALTAVDALLTLCSQTRGGEVVAISRHGVTPNGHAREPVKGIPPTWLNTHCEEPLSIRALVRQIRRVVGNRAVDDLYIVGSLRKPDLGKALLCLK